METWRQQKEMACGAYDFFVRDLKEDASMIERVEPTRSQDAMWVYHFADLIRHFILASM